jgi:hypothetical protein
LIFNSVFFFLFFSFCFSFNNFSSSIFCLFLYLYLFELPFFVNFQTNRGREKGKKWN